MKALSIFVAVVAHYFIGIHFDNAAIDVPKLCILIGICLNIWAHIGNEPSRFVPCWLTLMEGVLFSFAVIEIGLLIVWSLIKRVIEDLTTIAFINSGTDSVHLKLSGMILHFLALTFLVQSSYATFRNCPGYKKLCYFTLKTGPKVIKNQQTSRVHCDNDNKLNQQQLRGSKKN